MNTKNRTITRRQFTKGLGAAGIAAAANTLPFRFARAAGPLKVGLILPLSGIQGEIGIDCKRGADVALPLLKERGFPDIQLMMGDTETKVDTARSVAEKLITDGAQLLIGAFDSGQTTAIAQVAEQKGIPLVINIAAAPAITEQGYKFVFRNFTTAGMIVSDSLLLQKDIYAITGKTPKTAVLMHVNDTYGTSIVGGINAMMPKAEMPFTIKETISYDPAARDLSVEIAKAKAAGADFLWTVSRLNDAILLTREMVKQRWEPQAVVSAGPGWYEDQYLKSVGAFGNDIISTVPWYDPTKALSKALKAALAKAYPDSNMNTNHAYTVEALLIAADAYKRANSADPKALADALRATNITDNITIGTVKFNAKGQNETLRMAAIQNKDGHHVVIAPKAAADAQPIWPMRSWSKKG